MVAIAPAIVDGLLLGKGDRRRQLQDLPIRGDVWAAICDRPDRMHDLLVTPHRDVAAARTASVIFECTDGQPAEGKQVLEAARQITHLSGLVVANLTLEDIWSVLIPATSWWRKLIDGPSVAWPADDFKQAIEIELAWEREREGIAGSDKKKLAAIRAAEAEFDKQPNAVRQLIRLGVLIGLLRGASPVYVKDARPPPPSQRSRDNIVRSLVEFRELVPDATVGKLGAEALAQARKNYAHLGEEEAARKKRYRGVVYSVSSNRRADYATERSVPAIKADAARLLFKIDCKDISWAVLDSGIDETHPAFLDANGDTRIKATYDFGAIRRILNSGNVFDTKARKSIAKELAGALPETAKHIGDDLLRLAEALGDERPIDWSLVEPLVNRTAKGEGASRYTPVTPQHSHGTHVAGILGGFWETVDPSDPAKVKRIVKQQGVCPDIALYDFRVLGPDAEQTEFSVIAALQFIGWLNRRNAYPVIDGINMSLSIPHNVRNFACGHTPVCVEAEARVAEGIVVVAAAGNRGHQSYRLADGSTFESYASSTITDPGNAEGVITVGATHRYWPHTYGVSFFSSRGPTGDGRAKPDILAPGERIESVVPDKGGPDPMDGTSMAAPHVSGAAALLIARHRELKGQPARIKKILCATATDLGRERSFQGHGMLDVLRAIQSV